MTADALSIRGSRRGILAKAAALGAAAVAARAALEGRARAANGDPVKVGQGYLASSVTEIGGNYDDAVFSIYNDRPDGDAIVAFVHSPYQTAPNSAAIFGKHGTANGAGLWGEANEAGGVGTRGTARGVGGVGLIGEANGSNGVGVVTDASLAGIIGSVPPGRQGGPGVWGVSGVGYTNTDVIGVGPGVLGTGSKVGVAGFTGGTDLDGLRNLPDKAGVFGVSEGFGSSGVLGLAGNGSNGVRGEGGIGGSGGGDTAGSGGVRGEAPDIGIGVFSTAGTAVRGEGTGDDGVGVVGAGNGIGVSALSAGIALDVEGVNRFSQARRGSFEVGKRVAVVAGLSITLGSGVVATLNTGAGPGIHLLTARANQNTGKVRLILDKPAKRPAQFTLFVVNEAP